MSKPESPIEDRFWPKVAKGPDDECWEWTAGLTSTGYGQILVRTPKGWRPTAASRVAYMLTHGPIPDGLHVLHNCDNPLCCNPAHLRVGTPADNGRDRAERLRARGKAKLTPDAVREIRARLGTASQTALAAEYRVGQATISHIATGRDWKWVS